ncbi:hypothetical protein HK100_009612 [Physocladia obscura]|uniref:Uncharacterized protein n=1 Tax=Physocladia obscura TaxID=109957 RepID=A0AAD5T5V7_9FUNG|nr:hypothetical protein HK100_009612 [Physocladia obscura]
MQPSNITAQTTPIPSILHPNPNAFASDQTPRQFAVSQQRRLHPQQQKQQKKKTDIMLNLKNPNVVDIETAGKDALVQLLGRNEEFLAKKTLVNALEDKGAKLRAMNVQIRSRLDEISASLSTAGKSTENMQSPRNSNSGKSNFGGSTFSSSSVARDGTKKLNDEMESLRIGDDRIVGDLEKLVQGLSMSAVADNEPHAQNHSEGEQMNERQRKIFFAGGNVPIHLKETKVKILSFEESVALEKQNSEDQQRRLQSRLWESSGIVSSKAASDQKNVKSSFIFDKTKYRSALGPLPQDSNNDSDISDSEDSDYYEEYSDDG